MKKLLIVLLLLISKIGSAQKLLETSSYDTNNLKRIIYLHVILDQQKSNVSIRKDRFIDIGDSVLNLIQIRDITAKGMPEDLLFGEATILYPKMRFTARYLFCFNGSLSQYYTLSGFADNQFQYLFDYLNSKGFKISKEYFEKNKISVKGLDFDCLIDIYSNITKSKIKKISFSDKYKYPCLKYNFQPVLSN